MGTASYPKAKEYQKLKNHLQLLVKEDSPDNTSPEESSEDSF
jgi:hypothetical protein